MSEEYQVFPIILNSNNLITSSDNNIYEYRFPTNINFKNTKIALSRLSMYFSWYNISAGQNNNSFSIIVPSNGTYQIVLPSGYYSVADINSYLQAFCVQNNLFLIDIDGNYVYYIEILTNPTYYSLQFNFYTIPTVLPPGWTNPGLILPGASLSTQIVVPNTNIQYIFGLSPGTYPTVPSATNTSQLSLFTPQVNPIQSVVVQCSLLRNLYANPSTNLYSFTPGSSTGFGNLIDSEPSELSYISIIDGTYQSFRISFVDQNFAPLKINDTNIVITLLLKTRIE